MLAVRSIHSRRCSSVCSQVLVHRIVSARRVVAVAASFLVAACADRTRGASVPGTGTGTEFVGPSVPRRRSGRGRDHGADGRSAGCERGHPQGGRGAGRARRAAVERGDRGPDVRVGAHRRDPRVVAAAQARREQPSRARTVGGADRRRRRWSTAARSVPSGTVTFLFTDVEDSTALWERYPSFMPEVLARHDAAVRDAIARHRRPHLHGHGRRVRCRVRVGPGGCRCCG